MNRTEVATLLGAAAAIDPKIPAPNKQVLDMWTAMLDDIPADIGQSAVRAHYRSDHYATSKETITPGDIVTHHRRIRRDHTDQKAIEETHERRKAIESAPQPVHSLSELFAINQARRYGTDEQEAADHAAAHYQAIQRPCPRCGAPRGQRCTTHNGRPLRKTTAHHARQEN